MPRKLKPCTRCVELEAQVAQLKRLLAEAQTDTRAQDEMGQNPQNLERDSD